MIYLPLALFKTFYAATGSGIDIISVHPDVERSVREAGVQEGLVTIGVQGSEAAIGVCEYTEGVVGPLKAALAEWGGAKTTLKAGDRLKGIAGRSYSVSGTLATLCFGMTLTLPVVKGRLVMEPWLSVVLIDFDTTGKRREYYVHVLGEEKKEKRQGYETQTAAG